MKCKMEESVVERVEMLSSILIQTLCRAGYLTLLSNFDNTYPFGTDLYMRAFTFCFGDYVLALELFRRYPLEHWSLFGRTACFSECILKDLDHYHF